MFTRIGYKVGDAPFEDGGWQEVGATTQGIIEYCKELNVNCYVHHGRDLLTYIDPVNKTGMAIGNISMWGDHAYFYGPCTVGRCEMNYVTSRKANSNPHLEYSKLQKDKPMRDHYTACQIESPFPCQKVPPFDEWRTQSELYDAIESVFDNTREELASEKRKRHPDRDEEGLLFWCTDIHDVYEKLLDLQFFHKGTYKCVDVHRRYGSDMYSICGLLIEGKGLPK